jgi:aldehyde dehydrogenase (NAD+)
MGAPISFSRAVQAPLGKAHFATLARILDDFAFERVSTSQLLSGKRGIRPGRTAIRREAIGVCGLITPWNWPINQITAKLAPALAAGCTVVLKPSEYTPVTALILAEILEEAGVPRGVFNLINGTGPVVGDALARHEQIDLISITGSTAAGIAVARSAAATVKRVHQELGGKSPLVVLPDAPLRDAVTAGVLGCFRNTGQSCTAPTRLLVPQDRHGEAASIAAEVARSLRIGDPADPQTDLGPLANAAQFARVQELIAVGIAEGARLVTGGTGRPVGLGRGYYCRPTVFAAVDNRMRIAREEIFGPVLSILPYRDVAGAIATANDTPYGLAAYVFSADREQARAVGRELRAGMIYLNGAGNDLRAPFGGYKRSGNGREWGEFGLEEFLEIKAVIEEQES